MSDQPNELALDIDLQGGVVPISKAASSLAALLKRARERQQPVIVTQKGYPTGVLLPVDLYVALRARAEAAARPVPAQDGSEEIVGKPGASRETQEAHGGDQPGHEPATEAAPPPQRRRGGRRKRSEES